MAEKKYIDAEAAIERLEKLMQLQAPTARAIINAIPAAEVRPVVRGEWIGNTRHKSCSECHMTYCVPDGQDGELDMTAYHYCPNFGADMREES